MAKTFEDGLGGVTITTGTGPLAISGTISGYRAISQLADGESRCFLVRTDTLFEIGMYTKTGGASPSLARTQIFMNTSGTQTPVAWTAGEKTVHSAVSAGALASLTDGTTARVADLIMGGNKIGLGSDTATYIHTDIAGQTVFYCSNTEVFRVLAGNPNLANIISTDASASGGPYYVMSRISPTPAANDYIGGVIFNGRNSAGADKSYGGILGFIQDPTNASEDGGFDFNVYRNGTLTSGALLRSTGWAFMPTIQNAGVAVVVGKFSQDNNAIGISLQSDGLGHFCTSGQAGIVVNRKTSFGALVDFYRDNTFVGNIFVDASGVIAYTTFQGSHNSEFDAIIDDPPFGSVLCAVDKIYEPQPHLPMVTISRERGDSRVYGVFQGRNEEHGCLLAAGVGAGQALVKGKIKGGDLLWTSDEPGVAEVQPNDIVRAHTLGKVSVGDDRMDNRLVRCTLYCG